MIIIRFIVPLLILLGSCNSEPVNKNQIHGTWRCHKLPVGLAKKLKINDAPYEAEVILRKDGSFEVKDFPLRDPYRLISSKGAWSLIPANLTPSGKESIYLEGSYLVLKNGLGKLRL